MWKRDRRAHNAGGATTTAAATITIRRNLPAMRQTGASQRALLRLVQIHAHADRATTGLRSDRAAIAATTSRSSGDASSASATRSRHKLELHRPPCPHRRDVVRVSALVALRRRRVRGQKSKTDRDAARRQLACARRRLTDQHNAGGERRN